MGSVDKVASGAVWSVLYNLLNAAYGFIAIPLLINYFGKAEYGLIGLAQSVNVYIHLMDMGMNSTNIRFFSVWLSEKNHPKVGRLFQTSLTFYSVIGLLNALILIIVSFFTSSIFNITPEQDVILKRLLYILAVAAVLNWYSSCFDQIIRATENVAWIQKRSFIPKLLQVLILVLTITLKLPIGVYFFLTTFSFFIILPLSVSKIRKETPFIRFLPKFHWPTMKEVLPYTLNIFSFNIFKFSFVYLCPIFLGIRATMESVADYKILYTVASVITMITGVFMSSLLPSTSKVVAQHNRDAYYKVAYRGTKYLSMVTCFCTFGLISVGKDLLMVYVGESYAYLAPWLYLLVALSLSSHIQCVSSLILSGVNIKALSRMVIFSSLAALAVAWFLIPHYHIGGVILANLVYEAMQMTFYYVYYMPKKMAISSRKMLKSFLPQFFIGMVGCAVTFVVPNLENHWLNMMLCGAIFVALYGLGTLMNMNEEDKLFFRNLIKHQR